MRWAVGAYALALLALGLLVTTFSVPLGALGLAILCFPLTLAGGAFPDIDHHASRPYKMFRLFVTIAGGLVGAYVAFRFAVRLSVRLGATTGAPPLFMHGLLVIVAGLGAGLLSRVLLSIVRPSHRGPTHRIPIGVVVTAGLGALFWWLGTTVTVLSPAAIGFVSSGFFFVGFLSHLACDGMLTSLETYVSLS